jgi:desampylase
LRYLLLSSEQARAIARHALEDAPREACGIIGGSDDRASVIVPVPNVAPDPITTYRLDDTVLGRTLMQFHAQGLSLIGFYHSHPANAPIPSRMDIHLATYPDTAYLIVGLGSGTPEFAAWEMNAGEVYALPLHIGENPPSSDNRPLSRAQKAAIIIGALVAFAIMLIISLSLLPPAPEIVGR